jgi:hypothetical protein
LGGAIVNQATIQDAHLEAGSNISGGVLTGAITGTPGQPGIISSHIAAGAQLAYVVLDPLATLDPLAVLGEGTRFMSNSNITPGLTLTGVFSQMFESNTNAYSPNLAEDAVVGGNLLASINALPQLQGLGLQLAQQSNGYVVVAVGTSRVTMRPTLIRQTDGSYPVGINLLSDDSIIVVTADNGRMVTLQPTVQSPGALRSLLNSYGLTETLTARHIGNLNLILDAGTYVVTRPGLAAIPASAGMVANQIYAIPSGIPNISQFAWVFNSFGVLRQQALYTAPAYPVQLRNSLAGIPGAVVSIEENGAVSVKLGGLTYYGVFDLLVHPGSPANGQVQYLPAGDVNRDGMSDFKVVFPNGDAQIMYFLGAK